MNTFTKYIHCGRNVLCILIALTLAFPVASPKTAKAFTVGEEREVGEKLLYQVRSAFPIIGEPDIDRYINELGQQVLNVAGIQFFDYRFFVVESNQFNAFAAPSGLIFFYTELIESMQSEDELVSVMAHEIGHVVKRHLASQMKKGTIVNIAALGAALASVALGGGVATQALLTGSLAAGQSAQLYFSREDEKQADLLAYQWMKKLGRDPHGQQKMLEIMRRITRYRSGQVPQYLLTHPDPEARLDYVESLIAADNDPVPPAVEQKEFAFLRFKYRIMSIVRDNAASRSYFSGIVQDQNASRFSKAMAQYGLAQMDRRENNFEQAVKRIDEVIEEMPDQQILLVDKGIIMEEQGKFEDARNILYQQFLKNPDDMYVTFHLANVLERLGEQQKAEQMLRTVTNRSPEFPDAYFALGRILSNSNKPVDSKFYLGKYYLYEGNIKLAESCFREVSDIATDETMKAESQKNLELIERLNKG